MVENNHFMKKYILRVICLLLLVNSKTTNAAFIQIDPLLLNSSPFEYANDNPINFVDFNGKWPTGPFKDEILSRHPSLPKKFTLDKSAVRTLHELKPGRAIVGVVNRTSGKMYLNAVVRRESDRGYWSGKDWSDFKGKIRGKSVESITHNENYVTAHKQLANRVERIKGKTEIRTDKYFGFGLRIREEETEQQVVLTPRSRSLNQNSFHDFQIDDGNMLGDFELARMRWYRRKYGEDFDGVPKPWHEQPKPEDLIGPSEHGWLNDQWTESVRNELNQHLPSARAIQRVYW